uniref:RuvB-like chromatin remodeling ATPase n=1 Tax=Clandestinovirus TaxID=2831644 RepID=A0A8F8KUA3_9VIRU|nr:RuvB-like chromatin remodeling ATPase [Clandestinovirus]
MNNSIPSRKRKAVVSLDSWLNISEETNDEPVRPVKKVKIEKKEPKEPKEKKKKTKKAPIEREQLVMQEFKPVRNNTNVPVEVIDEEVDASLPFPPEIWCKSIFSKLKFDTLSVLVNSCRTLRSLAETEYPLFCLKRPYSLFGYQVETVQWMRSVEFLASKVDDAPCLGGIVCLEMGLGKTLISLVHILMEKKYAVFRQPQFPTLVISSKQILWEWKNTVEKFFEPDTLRVLYLHPSIKSDTNLGNLTHEDLLEYDVVVTTYDLISRAFTKNDIVQRVGDRTKTGAIYSVDALMPDTHEDTTSEKDKLFFDVTWRRIIADESDKFSNHRSNISLAMMALQGRAKWCLTGTPIRNREEDLWVLLKFCCAKDIPRMGLFDVTSHIGNTPLKFHIWQKTKRDAGIKLPPKTSERIIVPWSNPEDPDPLPYKCYLTYENATKHMFNDEQIGKVPYTSVLALFTRMRQICDAPHLAIKDLKEEAEAGTVEGITTDDVQSLKTASSCVTLTNVGAEFSGWLSDINGSAGINSPKMRTISNILDTTPVESKVVVFCAFVGTIRIAEALMKSKGMVYVTVEGQSSDKRRLEAIERFRRDPQVKVLIISYQVGGTGITLTEAEYVILAEPWWCPAVMEQAEDRVYRLGQTKPVFCYTLAMEKSIEERMLTVYCNAKKMMFSGLQNTLKSAWNGSAMPTTKIPKMKRGLDIDTMFSLLNDE